MNKDNFRKTVLLECIYEWYLSISLKSQTIESIIRVYQLFTAIFHKIHEYCY